MRLIQILLMACVAFTGLQAAAQDETDLRETRAGGMGVRDLDEDFYPTERRLWR